MRNVVLDRSNVADILPLNQVQKGMLFEYIRENGGLTNLIHLTVQFRDKLDFRLAQDAWRTVVNCHDVLKSLFRWRELSQPIQILLKDIEPQMNCYEGEFDEELVEIKRRHEKLVNIETVPFTISLWSNASHNTTMLITYNHILMDGWSMSCILRDFILAYSGILEGKATALTNIRIKDYVHLFQKPFSESSRTYWETYLEGYSHNTAVFKNCAGDYMKYEFHMLGRGSRNGNGLGRVYPTSVLVYAAVSVLLSMYSDTYDILFGITVSGRNLNHSLIHEMTGLFVNTLPLRVKLSANDPIELLLSEIQRNMLSHLTHERDHLADIQKVNKGINHFFDVLVAIENYPSDGLKNALVPINSIESDERTGFPMTIQVIEDTDIRFVFHYQKMCMDSGGEISRFIENFRNVMEMLLSDSAATVEELLQISPLDAASVESFNQTSIDYDKSVALIDVFEEHEMAYGPQTAVYDMKKAYTLDKVNSDAEAVCQVLIEQGVPVNSLVGVLMDRSYELLVTILGILKAGLAYLPLAHDIPEERLKQVIELSGLQYLITNRPDGPRLPSLHVIRRSEAPLDVPIKRERGTLAYVIYTSGSTGMPKGVMVQNFSVVNRLRWMVRAGIVTKDDVVLFKTPHTFDVSVWELFAWFFCGAQLYILDENMERNPKEILRAISIGGVTVLHFVPSMLNVFLDYIRETVADQCLISLKKVVVSGEELPCSVARKFFSVLGESVRLFNLYGPTETTVDVTYCEVFKEDESISIGRPIDNTRAYIVNSDMCSLPIGVKGELCIAGDGLARGYINSPDMTNDHFLTVEISGKVERIYRTGDIGAWRSDGTIDFFGRSDNQVKIRGNRIELNEIREQLIGHEAIKDAVVLVNYSKDIDKRYLCAFYVQGSEECDPISLRGYLSEKLPAYMIPQSYVRVENIPLTRHGKIDSRTLLDKENSVPSTLENKCNSFDCDGGLFDTITGILQKVLSAHQVMPDDNLFMMGLDSIKAIQIALELHKYGYDVDITKIRGAMTARDLSEYVAQIKAPAFEPYNATPRLLPMQKWFLHSDIPNKNRWSQTMRVDLGENADTKLLLSALEYVISKHPSLQYRFAKQGKEIVPEESALNRFVFLERNIANPHEPDRLLQEIQEETLRIIDIENGPLVAAVLINENGQYKLFIAIHHLVVDGLSWMILFHDLETAYRQLIDGKEMYINDETSSPGQWSEGMLSLANGNRDEIGYWVSVLTSPVYRNHDLPHLPQGEPVIGKLQKVFPATRTLEMKRMMQGLHMTMDELVIVSLGLTLSEWFSTSYPIIINIEGTGRKSSLDRLDITRTIGWFTSIYPFILRNPQGLALDEYAMLVRNDLQKIPNQGELYGLFRYLMEDNELAGPDVALLSVNYLGEYNQLFDGTLFVNDSLTVVLDKGENSKIMHDMEIYFIIIQNQLQLTFEYRLDLYKNKDIENIFRMLEKKIYMVLTCLTQLGNKALMPPVHANDLEVDEWRALQERYDDLVEDVYDLSNMQLGMLFYTALDGNAYCQWFSFEIDGIDFDDDLLRESFRMLVKRHQALRLNVCSQGLMKVRNIVLRNGVSELICIDVSAMPMDKRDEALLEAKKHVHEQCMVLEQGPLFNMASIRKSGNSYLFIAGYHHIILDGWSISILMKDFFQIYAYLAGKTAMCFPESNRQFGDYIRWLNAKSIESTAKEYWKSVLRQPYESHALNIFKRSVLTLAGMEKKTITSVFEGNLLDKITRFVGENKVTLASFFLTAWKIVLRTYGSMERVAVGIVTSGRDATLDDVDQIVGLLSHTLPFISAVREDEAVLATILNSHVKMVEMLQYGVASITEIQSLTGTQARLFDHLFAVENYPFDPDFITEVLPRAKCGRIEEYGSSNYDLDISIIPDARKLSVQFRYNQNAIDTEYVEQALKDYMFTIEWMIHNPTGDIGTLTSLMKRPVTMDTELDFTLEFE